MPVKIFFCYAHEDEELLNKLKTHLRPLQRQGLIDIWYDRDISAGTKWEEEIEKHLNEANIILLLVSPDFMDSDYCYGKEMRQALERDQRGEACVIPIIFRPALWKMPPLSKLQVLPRDGIPVIDRSWYSIDEAFVAIAEGVLKVVLDFRKKLENADAQASKREIDNEVKSGKHFNNFIVHTLCPFCIEDFVFGDCEIVSTVTPGKVLKAAPKNKSLEQARSRLFIEPLTSEKYATELARRKCPNCKNLLPYNLEYVPTISIAVVANTSSEISNYIAALTYILQKEGLQQVEEHARVKSLTPEIEEEYIRNILKLLISDNKALPPTAKATNEEMKPLIYELFFRKSSKHPTQRFNLNLYHISGEDYGSQKITIQTNRCILNANAIIFLLDPLTMPSVAQEIPQHIREQSTASSRTNSVLASIIHLFELSNPKSHLRKPIAFTLLKSELLKYVTKNEFSFLQDPKSTVSLVDLETINREVRDFIHEFGERNLLGQSGVFNNVSFFAISATGSQPDAYGKYPIIKPKRVVDPLQWILLKLGII
jgi:hypothetical protein